MTIPFDLESLKFLFLVSWKKAQVVKNDIISRFLEEYCMFKYEKISNWIWKNVKKEFC